MIKVVKIIIFGATGGIGRLLVKQALDNGYNVRAYIRNPSKLKMKHQNLETIQGELHDFDRIKQAIS
jgi:putative NADH-flavin reductase